MCRLSRNSGALTSWNPKGLSRRVAGKLYLLSIAMKCSNHHFMDVKVKVKLSRYRPGQALGGSRRLRLQNF
jgi:hypothetical protein